MCRHREADEIVTLTGVITLIIRRKTAQLLQASGKYRRGVPPCTPRRSKKLIATPSFVGVIFKHTLCKTLRLRFIMREDAKQAIFWFINVFRPTKCGIGYTKLSAKTPYDYTSAL